MGISDKDFSAIVNGKVPDMVNQEVLLLAVAVNNTAVFEDLITKGYHKNIGIDLEQCLFVAVKKRYLNMVKLLVKAGADVNFPMRSILIEAIIRNSLPIVKFLFRSGAYIDIRSNESLKLAIHYQRASIVEFLTENSDTINYSDALISAIHSQNISIIEYFISKGVVINDLCFMVAASNNYYDVLVFLFEQVNDETSIDLSDALHRAIEHNHTEVVKLLIVTHKVPVDQKMLYTATEKNNIDIVRLIIDHNIEIDDRALNIAVENDNVEIFSIFLQKKKDVDFGPLFRLAITKNRKCIIALIISKSIGQTNNVFDCVKTFTELSVSSS